MPSDLAVELYYDGAWHDLVPADDVFAEPIKIMRGDSDEIAAPRPASVELTLANDDDRYRTTNPESPLYGKAGVNTPLRVSVGGTVRAQVEASSWVAGQTRDFRARPKRGKAWVDVEGGGLLQRINQWSQPLRSALYRYVDRSGVTPAEWWPMEDVAGSSQAVSAAGGTPMIPVTTTRYTLPGGEPIAPGGAPDFAEGAGIAGSAPLPSFQGGGTLFAPIRTTTFDGYAIDWVMQFAAGTDAGGTTSADVLRWRETGTYVMFTVNVVKDHVTVFHANAADAAALTSTGRADAPVDMYDGAPHHFRYQVRQNGGNYSATLYVDGGQTVVVAADNFGSAMAGTVGVPTTIEWNPGEDRGDHLPVAAGHLIVWASGQVGDQPAEFYALNGHAGERAAIRFGRLIDEELGTGKYYASDSSTASSKKMGPQRPDTLANLIRECVTTDDALLFDHRTDLRLYYLCRVDRYNQTPALTLNAADPDNSGLPTLPAEVTDDLGIHNIVTVSQRDGGDYTAEDATSSMGTQPPPDGRGEYKQQIPVNVYDESGDLPQLAGYYLNRGTVDRPRFPQVVVNLAALDAARVAEVEQVDVGSVIEITGYREYTIRLYVVGYTEVITRATKTMGMSRTITFTCAPDQQFDIGVYSDDRRYDLRTCTLRNETRIGLGNFTMDITADEAWSSTSSYDLLIAGELIGVPAGAMAARTGSPGAYQQVVTGAVRSKNGIRKTLPAGAEVHVANPGRWGLR